MKKFLIFCFIFFSGLLVFSQSNFSQFKKLSSPKKWWVVFHPFKAKKSLFISKKTNRITDSIRKTKTLDGDKSGGQVDAFRHAFWMASLRLEIGRAAARSLGKAHEKENYQYFKDNKLEDGTVPDKVSMDMDLFNNEVGLSLVKRNEKITTDSLVMRVVNAIKQGKMKIIKKNIKRKFLTCDGIAIKKASLKGKWVNKKCLVPSNQIAKRD